LIPAVLREVDAVNCWYIWTYLYAQLTGEGRRLLADVLSVLMARLRLFKCGPLNSIHMRSRVRGVRLGSGGPASGAATYEAMHERSSPPDPDHMTRPRQNTKTKPEKINSDVRQFMSYSQQDAVRGYRATVGVTPANVCR